MTVRRGQRLAREGGALELEIGCGEGVECGRGMPPGIRKMEKGCGPPVSLVRGLVGVFQIGVLADFENRK
jgi:hypothetical protein